MPSATTPKDVNAIVLAGLRVEVGLLFLLFGEYKVFGTQFRLGGGFQSWIHQFLASGTYPFMVPVLRDFVLVHGAAIAFWWPMASGDWFGTCFGSAGAHRECMWAGLYARTIILVELSGRKRSVLAIFRCRAGSSGLGVLLLSRSRLGMWISFSHYAVGQGMSALNCSINIVVIMQKPTGITIRRGRRCPPPPTHGEFYRVPGCVLGRRWQMRNVSFEDDLRCIWPQPAPPLRFPEVLGDPDRCKAAP